MTATATQPTRQGIRRIIFMVLGVVSVGMAAVGTIVPGIPTTVFLIAALFFFARSSPSLERRLRASRLFGPYIRRFAGRRGMPLRAKLVAIVSMWTAITVSCIMLASYGKTVQAAIMAAGAVGSFVVMRVVRTAPAHNDEEPSPPGS